MADRQAATYSKIVLLVALNTVKEGQFGRRKGLMLRLHYVQSSARIKSLFCTAFKHFKKNSHFVMNTRIIYVYTHSNKEHVVSVLSMPFSQVMCCNKMLWYVVVTGYTNKIDWLSHLYLFSIEKMGTFVIKCLYGAVRLLPIIHVCWKTIWLIWGRPAGGKLSSSIKSHLCSPCETNIHSHMVRKFRRRTQAPVVHVRRRFFLEVF